MSSPAAAGRPFVVTLLGVFIYIVALFNIVTGIWWMVAAPAITDHLGTTIEVSPFLIFLNGLLSLVLGIMFIWLASLTFAGSVVAYELINLLAIINLIFGLFRLPYGWGAIALSILVLLLVNLRSSQQFLSKQPTA
ncbi:MAG: hypothetical protein KGP10_07810 [Actinomycetales bacterium]|nr:hypothetical protein [Actinomycetales bacterium]